MKRYIVLLGLLLLVVGCQLSSPKAVPEPTPSPLQSAAVGVPTTERNQAITQTDEIKILGKYGFDPAESRVSEGQIVVWRNDNPQKKGESLTFLKEDAGRTIFSTNLIRYGETYSHQFSTGTYDYWSVGFGVKGKLIVE